MSFFEYLTSDKKSHPYWVSLILIILILTFLTQLMHTKEYLFWLQPIIIVSFFFISYIISYKKYLMYFRLLKKLNDNNIQFRNGECDVEIFQRSFKTVPIRQNYEVIVKISPQTIKCNYIAAKDSFMLFCVVYDFNVFRRHINPIVIKFDYIFDSNLKLCEKNKLPFKSIYYEENSLCIVFKENKSEFKEIRILNFSKYLK